MTDLLAIYSRRYEDILTPIADRLATHIQGQLEGIKRIDRISARAKDPLKFVEKAQRKENGILKYDQPFSQIQDQLGARVIVFFRQDVQRVSDAIVRYFQHIEEQALVPDSEWKFGYIGLHYILALPSDAVPKRIDLSDAPRFFELQIKTLFQHAWSEANHDLGYKAPVELSSEQQRKLAFTAAQAWGADEIFTTLHDGILGSNT